MQDHSSTCSRCRSTCLRAEAATSKFLPLQARKRRSLEARCDFNCCSTAYRLVLEPPTAPASPSRRAATATLQRSLSRSSRGLPMSRQAHIPPSFSGRRSVPKRLRRYWSRLDSSTAHTSRKRRRLDRGQCGRERHLSRDRVPLPATVLDDDVRRRDGQSTPRRASEARQPYSARDSVKGILSEP